MLRSEPEGSGRSCDLQKFADVGNQFLRLFRIGAVVISADTTLCIDQSEPGGVCKRPIDSSGVKSADTQPVQLRLRTREERPLRRVCAVVLRILCQGFGTIVLRVNCERNEPNPAGISRDLFLK